MAFEETVQMLMPKLESPRIRAVCEYSEAAESAEWVIDCNGPRYNALETGDELSLSVLKGVTSSMDYTWTEEEELPNRLALVIKDA